MLPLSRAGTAAATTGATGKDTEAADEEDEDEEEPASQVGGGLPFWGAGPFYKAPPAWLRALLLRTCAAPLLPRLRGRDGWPRHHLPACLAAPCPHGPMQRPQRRASRGAAGKRLRYNEDSGAEEEADEGERGQGDTLAALSHPLPSPVAARQLCWCARCARSPPWLLPGFVSAWPLSATGASCRAYPPLLTRALHLLILALPSYPRSTCRLRGGGTGAPQAAAHRQPAAARAAHGAGQAAARVAPHVSRLLLGLCSRLFSGRLFICAVRHLPCLRVRLPACLHGASDLASSCCHSAETLWGMPAARTMTSRLQRVQPSQRKARWTPL